MRWALLIAISSCALWGAAVQPPVFTPTGPYFPARYTAGSEWDARMHLGHEVSILKALGEPSVFAASEPTLRVVADQEIPRQGVCLRITRDRVVRKSYGKDLVPTEVSRTVTPAQFDLALVHLARSEFADGQHFGAGLVVHGTTWLVEVRDEHGYRVGVGLGDTGLQPLRTFLEGL